MFTSNRFINEVNCLFRQEAELSPFVWKFVLSNMKNGEDI